MPKTAVVIVTYNGIRHIERCVRSVLNSSSNVELIVFDNASDDSTVELLKKEFTEIQVIENKSNIGFGQGNNIAIKLAIEKGADYVFLLNQDAYILPDTIGNLIDCHKKISGYGVISPLHLYWDKNQIENKFVWYMSSNGDFMNDLFFRRNNLKLVYEVPFVCAAVWLLPVETIKKVGYFDDLFFHFGEDDNYLHRVSYHGLKVGVVPTAFAHHDLWDRHQKPPIFDDEYYFRRIKIELANILIDDANTQEKINDQKRINFRSFIKSLLKLNIERAIHFYGYWKRYVKIEKQIIESRRKNKLPYSKSNI